MSSSRSCVSVACWMQQLHPSTNTKQQYTMHSLCCTPHPLLMGVPTPQVVQAPASVTPHPLCVARRHDNLFNCDLRLLMRGCNPTCVAPAPPAPSCSSSSSARAGCCAQLLL